MTLSETRVRNAGQRAGCCRLRKTTIASTWKRSRRLGVDPIGILSMGRLCKHQTIIWRPSEPLKHRTRSFKATSSRKKQCKGYPYETHSQQKGLPDLRTNQQLILLLPDYNADRCFQCRTSLGQYALFYTSYFYYFSLYSSCDERRL